MEILLDWLTPRALLVVGVLAASTVLGVRYRGLAARRYDEWRHPPAGQSAGDPAIQQDIERQESLRFQGLYRRVCDDIAAARSQGYAVDALQRAADALLPFDKPDYRAAAIERLNRLRLAIPHKSEVLRPSNIEDGVDDEIAKPQTVPVRAPARKRTQ